MINMTSNDKTMEPAVQELLDTLQKITPLNIHQVTDADDSLRESFHGMWYRHSPMAARYMLLPYLHGGKISVAEGF